MKQKFQAYSITKDPVDQWHENFGIFILIVSINFLRKMKKFHDSIELSLFHRLSLIQDEHQF